MSTPASQGPPAPEKVWSSGDYADVADRMIPALGARLVEMAGVRAGQRVLDVAAGTGNAALPAARAGARVTALDITPELLQTGAKRAADAGLEIAWVHGDAQALPFADAGFDRVLSCVGVQFCADHRAAATELLRVCRPGGRIALIAWTPEGFIGQVLATISAAIGASSGPGGPGGPGGALSPLSWGSESGLAELFGSERAARAVVCREHVEMPAASAEAWVDYMAAAYGPMVRARAALDPGGAWAPLRERLIEIAATHDSGDGATFAARAEYLGVVID
jgi:SAM-dependent methyltransferase